MRRTVLMLLACAAGAGCGGNGGSGTGQVRYVNVQITELDDGGALSRLMVELDTRGIRGSLMVGATMAVQFCEQLRAYDQTGHELMVYGRPPAPPGESIYLADLSLAEQRQHVRETKQALEDCLGHPVLGFRSYQFSHDANTWAVLDEVGLQHNLSYVAGTSNTVAGHVDDEWPHRVPGHAFWAVPLHSVRRGGRVSPLCDMPFSSVSAEEWSTTLSSELDDSLDAGLPFKVLFHSYFSARDAGRLQAFIALLDRAQARAVQFVSAAQLVELASGGELALTATQPARASLLEALELNAEPCE